MTDSPFPATLLDYNGLLVDDEHVHLEAFRAVLAPLGISLTEATYWDRYLGYDDAGAFAAILGDHGREADEGEVARLVEAKRPEYLARARGALRTFPGAAALVRRRATAGPIVVVSGALRDEIELGLATLGVRELVAGIVAAEDTRRCKPDPEGYLLGVEALARVTARAAAERALAFEDSLAGIAAARAAGLACAAVTHSYPRASLESAGALLVADHLDTLDEAALARAAAEARARP
ncbi:MAG: HAD family phosphatase [Polyangiaceae bacterium]|nr:HAD family phosphatase [Polyangiaceae bacterium]